MRAKVFGLLSICLLLISIGGIAKTGGPGPSGYHLINTIQIGGPGGWDYLTMDTANRRLYVSHSTHVVVIDVDAGKVVGDIPDTKGVHGIAIANDLGRGFTSNGGANTVTIFDLKTLKTIGTVAVGTNPDAIIYEPLTKRIFTFNGRSNDTTAVDAATGTVAGTIPLGGKPESAVSNGKGRVFVNIETKDEVIAFDPKKLSVEAHWPLAPGKEPSGMAFDAKNNRIFSGCGGSDLMTVMNAETGKVVASVPIGKGVDANGFDPETKLAFSSNGQAGGTLTVVHQDSPDKYTVVENVVTHAGGRTMALDTKTHNVFIAVNEGTRQAPVADSFKVLVFGK